MQKECKEKRIFVERRQMLYKRGIINGYNKCISDLLDVAESSQYGDADGKEYFMSHLEQFIETLENNRK